MDLCVVAAAAGAGYLAKYWNRLSNNRDSSSQLSSEDSKFENPESPSCPFRRQAWRDIVGKDVSSDRRASDGKSSDVNSPDGLLTEVASSSNRGLDSEKIRHFRTYSKSNLLSISNLSLLISPNENFTDIEDENEQSSNIGGNYGFLFPDSSAGEVGSIHHSAGNNTSLRTKHLYGHFSKPVNSLESCLISQLCKEHAEMEEYVISSLSSPSRATRSFLVSDGSRIISRTSTDSSCALIGGEEYKLHIKNANVYGIPSLPKRSLEDPKKIKLKAGKGRSGRLSSSKDVFGGKHIHIQHDATFLFSLGISFGIITSMMENKKEVDKLRELLKQTENLVQDLQEELEMKDSVTVKKLNNENYGSQDTCDHSFYEKELNGFSPEKNMDNSPRNNCKELYDQREDGGSESMSKIEAELEAELERLGLNMNTSSLDRRLSELFELDPDFEADFAQGELRTDTASGKAFAHPKSNEDASDSSTALSGIYVVSPHELSLRLHEVIQSRLEERVKELEIALESSRRKIQIMESEHDGCYRRDFSSPGQASPFTRGSPLTYDDCDPLAQPLVMNLSGEALDAYNEAYEELIKIDESEENSPSGIQHAGPNGSVTFSTVNGEKMSRELTSNKVTMLEGQGSGVSKFNVVTGDENCGFDYEMERQLIRQIVERTKKGSPVFENAERILYSMDEDEL